MQADEIREQPILRTDGPYGGGDAEPAISFFLREIAAQLAGLNEKFDYFIEWKQAVHRGDK